MNLKEAFRYQNFLDKAINEISAYLIDGRNVTTITRLHKRKAVWDETDDVEETVMTGRKFACTVDDTVDFFRGLLSEKAGLTYAISRAKREVGFDMDAEIAINAWRQKCSGVLKCMAEIKPTTRTYNGSSFRFNAEGNQVTYMYEVEENTELDFDKDGVKTLMRKISRAADDASTKIDQVVVQTQVMFIPLFELTDSLEDMFEKYAAHSGDTNFFGTI